ncbi:hypothetical protein AVEN_17766-1 [Araneus ventricosus]|uniref:Uncharacterized protein n=1 Tax=Araneus ventricosus TaxID=182803 RepID=A0A4Y2MVQ6_ARAVE|nr:hypothetical protein AVEN_17766-1 [Araneus ventricosus]
MKTASFAENVRFLPRRQSAILALRVISFLLSSSDLIYRQGRIQPIALPRELTSLDKNTFSGMLQHFVQEAGKKTPKKHSTEHNSLVMNGRTHSVEG